MFVLKLENCQDGEIVFAMMQTLEVTQKLYVSIGCSQQSQSW